MKVAIDARAVLKSGMGNYTQILLSLLPQYGRDIEVVPIDDRLTVNRDGFVNKYVNSFRRMVFNQSGMIKLLKERKVDLLHNPKNMGVPFFPPCKVVTTIHDVIPKAFPEYYLDSMLEKLYYETMIRTSIRRSNMIITISDFSKRELMKFYAVPEEKIIVIPQACSDSMHIIEKQAVQAVLQKYNVSRPYIMTIGGSEYRKNVKTVINAYLGDLEKKFDLVVVGGAWRKLDLKKEFSYCKSIKFVKGISDEDLTALYNGAETFVFASLYEGFGLPLLEAMRCGTPVIAAQTSCLSEVSGDAAKYFSPLNFVGLRNVLSEVLSNESLKQEMINKGFERQKLYSWEKTVALTYKTYERTLNMMKK